MATHNIALADAAFDGTVEGVVAGDLILIEAGSRNELAISNVIGSAESPVWILNDGGVVDLDADATWCGIYLVNCEHFVLSGRGGPEAYGIVIYNFTAWGIFAEDTTQKAVAEGIEIGPDNSGNGGGGIGWQTTTAQANPFTTEDVEIRYSYLHDVDMDCIYYGNYASANVQPSDGLNIHHCIISGSGWTTILIKQTINADIHHNLILDGGADSGATSGHGGSGIACAGAVGDTNDNHSYHHNIIDNCARGIELNRHGSGFTVHHNHVMNCSEIDTWGGEGIVIWLNDNDVTVYENTIKEYENYGIYTQPGDHGDGAERLDSNIFCSDDGGATHISSDYDNQEKNETGGIADLVFEGDYHDTLAAGSPAIAAGVGGINCGWKQGVW